MKPCSHAPQVSVLELAGDVHEALNKSSRLVLVHFSEDSHPQPWLERLACRYRHILDIVQIPLASFPDLAFSLGLSFGKPGQVLMLGSDPLASLSGAFDDKTITRWVRDRVAIAA